MCGPSTWSRLPWPPVRGPRPVPGLWPWKDSLACAESVSVVLGAGGGRRSREWRSPIGTPPTAPYQVPTSPWAPSSCPGPAIIPCLLLNTLLATHFPRGPADPIPRPSPSCPSPSSPSPCIPTLVPSKCPGAGGGGKLALSWLQVYFQVSAESYTTCPSTLTCL